MFDHKKNRLLLRTRLRTMSGYLGDSLVAWENQDFITPEPNKTTPAPWMRETYFKVDETLAATQQIKVEGFYRVDVFYPKGAGTEAPEDLAKAVREVFSPGQSLQNADIQIELFRTEPLPMIETADSPWVQFPVIIHWRGFATN